MYTKVSKPRFFRCPGCNQKNNPSFSNCWRCGEGMFEGIPAVTTVYRHNLMSLIVTMAIVGILFGGVFAFALTHPPVDGRVDPC